MEEHNQRLLNYGHRLTAYLKRNYPECVLMPTESNYSNKNDVEKGKNPAYAHKAKTTDELWSKWDERLKRGVSSFQKGLLIILRKDLIVIDVDDHQNVLELEQRFPTIVDTATQQTSKGKHYFFKRSKKCDELEIVDATRKLCDENGNDLPIDIKTVCSTGTGGVISIYPSPNKKWIQRLHRTELQSFPDDLLAYIVEHHKDYKDGEKQKKKQTLKKELKQNFNNNVFIHEATSLVKLLSVERADSYMTWMLVGWCLFNISNTLLPAWIDFSKKSSKYKDDKECTDLWNAMDTRNQKYTLASLHYWAKHDDPYEYKMFVNNSVYPLIINCTCSSGDIAHVAAKLLRGRFVCPDPHSNTWFEFNGTLWKKDRNRELRLTLSKEVKDHFMVAITKIRQNMESVSETGDSKQSLVAEINKKQDQLEKIAHKLCENAPKKQVVEDLCDILYDEKYYEKLDADPNLLAFDNGVLELRTKTFRQARPEDYLTLSVKYDYIHTKNERLVPIVKQFWESIHPDEEQRTYMIKTIARQLYGDSGAERFHIHAGSQGMASNGKTSFFEVLSYCLGDYIYKFGVEHLTAAKRQDAQKPSPEFAKWKGKRIMYCTEPSPTDVLNSGILKDYSGNEVFNYRLLHSNTYDHFSPQFCMHIMCNEPPKVEGQCQGIKRRIRKIDYISEFVDDPADVDEKSFKFLKNKELILGFKEHELKMEFLRYLIEHYEHDFRFLEPDIVKQNSQIYLEENDCVLQFVNKYIVEGTVDDFFTMKQANDYFKMDRDLYNGRVIKKERVENILRCKCVDAKKIQGKKYNKVFCGFKLIFEQFY